MASQRFFDIVVSGPDMSGTSSQVGDIISYFEEKGLKVRDLRYGEADALFHAERFKDLNRDFRSLRECKEALKNGDMSPSETWGAFKEWEDLVARKPHRYGASCVENDVSTYINPESADVWVLEEPSKRGLVRMVDMNMSQFGSEHNPRIQGYSYGDDRFHEFKRFREPLRDAGRIIIRSRSEESGAYQIRDEDYLPSGIPFDEYVRIPGNELAFRNPPSIIFAVCAPGDWTEEEYKELKRQRSGDRALDDHELNPQYQLLVNRRYATDWLKEEFYKPAIERVGGGYDLPRFVSVRMYGLGKQGGRAPNSKEYINAAIRDVLDAMPEVKERLS